jgi:ATP-dependent protease HslVU (ClpYQ) peptidase subunit
MTCIVGLEYAGHVWMGADSVSIAGWDRNVSAMPKLFTLWSEFEDHRQRVPFLVGCGGSPRIAQILQHHVRIPPPDTTNDVAYLVQSFIEPVRNAIKDFGAAAVENATESAGNTRFLLGYNSRVYLVDSDFQLTRFTNGMAAIGVGDSYAMGAMLAMKTKDPEKRIRKSLSIAEQLCMGVRPPFEVRCL